MGRHTGWNKFYQLYVDGKPTAIEVCGPSKTKAYPMLEDQWPLYYPDLPVPARRRCRLEMVDSARWGNGT